MAVASAGPYASLHLAPDRYPCQHPTAQFFLQAGCPSCRPTNSVKALKAKACVYSDKKMACARWVAAPGAEYVVCDWLVVVVTAWQHDIE